ncbi:helix-hairpin-helix domain-containing protein [Actinomadura sp. KC06]|uniref:ComEA family DNA-binding protein n=1 Tax=Actinomadura sp. KC06 TaxID=2530369 RepID=UPI00105071F0|nr:helix-hairpin-helix domain-containing protein [Actinomadura sp. KC06]TDD28415.1 helix-hairpin-helix domain-containing protein [Actinomadura sp. KC06]
MSHHADHPGRRPAQRPYGTPGWRPPYPGPPVPPVPPMPPAPIAPSETARGILWAFVPFITLGYGTPISFLYAAIRRGSWNLGATAAGYGVGTAGVITLLQMENPILIVLGTFVAVLLWISGTAHAFAVRSSVFPREVPRNRLNEHAIEVAMYRRSLRDEARTLAAEDPALARELRIGRPDVPRTYDDGGLVDVNHVPPEVLAALPGMTPELAERVVRRREEHGGFVSAEEMAVDADIPPDVLPEMADFTIFLR